MSGSEIILRLKSYWVLKLVLGSGLIVMFAALYFLPQRYPIVPATVLHPMLVEQMIPFMPNTVYLYESLWLLIPVAPWLMKTKEELNQYSKGLLLMSGVGCCFFFLYPTMSPRPTDIHDANMFYRRLVQIDSQLNAFPSLHAAYAVFHAACCHVTFGTGTRHKLLQGIFWSWALVIIFSTLLTKQHVFIDLIAGAMLGLVSFAIFCRPNTMSGHREFI
jgi:membrane-associated phospholipid phosphatase